MGVVIISIHGWGGVTLISSEGTLQENENFWTVDFFFLTVGEAYF